MSDDCLPPPELLRAIQDVTSKVKLSELREAAQRLSVNYRNGINSGSTIHTWNHIDRLAYIGARMPATYRATLFALRELRTKCPNLSVASLFDVGAGPGTSLWAASSVFGELSYATLLEPDESMVSLARRLLSGSSLEVKVNTTWLTSNVNSFPTQGRYDLVVAAYLLTELQPKQRLAAIDSIWQACEKVAVFVEPGSMDGFQNVIEVRQRLLDLGGSVVSPCPHEDPCPLTAEDWCHFAARLNRTPLQRKLKSGVLSYEDEKYSFLVVTRGDGTRSSARVIRRPRMNPGHVILQICSQAGLRDITVTKSDRDNYRRARKVRWGDSWDD